jgi:hypothetical protein
LAIHAVLRSAEFIYYESIRGQMSSCFSKRWASVARCSRASASGGHLRPDVVVLQQAVGICGQEESSFSSGVDDLKTLIFTNIIFSRSYPLRRWLGSLEVSSSSGVGPRRGHLPHPSFHQKLRRIHPVSKLKLHLTSDVTPAVVSPDVTLDLDSVAGYPIMKSWRIAFGDHPRYPSTAYIAAAALEECQATEEFLAR